MKAVLLLLMVACGPAPATTSAAGSTSTSTSTGTTGAASTSGTPGTAATDATTTQSPTTFAGDTTTTGSINTGSSTTETSGLPAPSCPDRATTGDATAAEMTTAGTGDPPAPSCPDHPTTDACCCFVDIGAQNMSSEGTVSVCGVQELCPAMHFVCSSDFSVYDCPSEALTTNDEAAIACALQALAEGQVGRLSWVVDDEFAGYSKEHVELDLVGDGTLFRQGGHHVDSCFLVYAVEHAPMLEGGYFSDCLAVPDWRVRFDCIRQALTCPPLETCIEAHYPDLGFLRNDPGGDRLARGRTANGC